MKKILAAFLSMMLVLLPLAAVAETNAGYVGLKIIDPVISYNDMAIDLTGLEIDLSAAVDGSNADNPALTIAAAALVNGTEALSGAAVMDMTEAAFRVNGMQNAYKVKLDALLEESGMSMDMFKESMASATLSAQTSMEVDFEKIAEEWVKLIGPLNEEEAEVEFEGKTVTAKSITVTMGKAEVIGLYEKLFEEMNMADEGKSMIETIDQSIEDMNIVVTVYEIDENTVLENIDMSITAEGETITGNGSFTIKVPAEGEGVDMRGGMEMRPEGGAEEDVVTMELTMLMENTDDFEDATKLNFNMVMKTPDVEEGQIALYMDVIPKAVEGGFHYDYSFGMAAEEVKFEITGSAEQAGGKIAGNLSMAFDDGSDAGSLDFSIAGDVTESEGDSTFAGNLHLGGSVGEEKVQFETKVEAVYSENVEGRMLNIASLNALDLMEQSAEDMEAFQAEIEALGTTATFAMMQLPGVQALMGAMSAAE